jgi:alanine-glyoxylate transaminase/serine-glyoxylate transaminase/serine-pyruvate transaminase
VAGSVDGASGPLNRGFGNWQGIGELLRCDRFERSRVSRCHGIFCQVGGPPGLLDSAFRDIHNVIRPWTRANGGHAIVVFRRRVDVGQTRRPALADEHEKEDATMAQTALPQVGAQSFRSEEDHALLMIPGPTPVSPEVLAAGARPVLSHSDPNFRASVGETIAYLRQVFDAPTSQPMIVGGSGTLAMEIALANLIEPGDRVLILETGVFGRRFQEIALRNGAEIRIVAASVGQPVEPEQLRRALHEFRPKVVTITHVDTSTGVRVDLPELCRLGREAGALVVVDGVCSIGGEEFHGDDWGVDVALTASQKALGAPPGLAIVTVGPRARAVREARKSPFPGYFTDFKNWLPVMESYEGGAPGYFGTPAVTTLVSLHVAMVRAMAEGLPARFHRHARISRAFKAGIAALGMENVAASPAGANTLTVARYPKGVGDELIDAVQAEGVTIARGIHPELRGKAFRVGHMGSSGPAEILVTLAAIERGLHRLGHPVELGAGLAAAQRALSG